MKFLIVLAIVALAAPSFAQTEEKKIEKRGILLGGGLGHAGLSGGLGLSAPVVTKSIGISSGLVGHGLSGGLGLGVGHGLSGGLGLAGGHGLAGGYGW